MDAAMSENDVRAGLITRVVRVALTNNDDSHRCGCHGYGIIQGIEGRDVFFVDSCCKIPRSLSWNPANKCSISWKRAPLVEHQECG